MNWRAGRSEISPVYDGIHRIGDAINLVLLDSLEVLIVR
jgi:hypothetical protein